MEELERMKGSLCDLEAALWLVSGITKASYLKSLTDSFSSSLKAFTWRMGYHLSQ